MLQRTLYTNTFTRINVNIHSFMVLQEYWVLMERRKLLKPVLGGMRIVALSISSHD